MTSSGMSTVDDDGDDNERIPTADVMDSSAEISGSCVLLMDDMIVRCLIMRSSCLDNMCLLRFRYC